MPPKQMIRDFTASGGSSPHYQELDEKEYFDRSILKKMGDLHFLGICLPEKYGGAGMDYVAPRFGVRRARVRGHVSSRHHVRSYGAE